MTNLQIQKLKKILDLVDRNIDANITINIHEYSKLRARKIMRLLPKGFKRKRSDEPDAHWFEATGKNVYGLGRLEVTVFYPKKGGE